MWIAIDRLVAVVIPIKLGLVVSKIRTKAIERFITMTRKEMK